MRRAANSKWVDRLARLGLAARGLVYVIVGVIAVTIAVSGSHRSADRTGALTALAATGWGQLLVVVAAIGFAGYAVWRLTEAVWGHQDEDGAKKVVKHLGSAARAVLYGSFAYSAIRLVTGGGNGKTSDQTSKEWTARLMKEPFGRFLVIAAGVVFIGAGIWWVWKGFKTKFEEKLKVGEMSPGMRTLVEKLGLGGYVARGVVMAFIGGFLIRAAVLFDPKKAKGLDGSLREIAHQPWGEVGLTVVALGLVAFGLYSFAEARYRQT